MDYLELNTKYTNVSHRVSKRRWVDDKLKIANWFLSALDLISDSDKLNSGTFYSEHQLVNWNLLKMPARKYFPVFPFIAHTYKVKKLGNNK